jgi:hypothetical protein
MTQSVYVRILVSYDHLDELSDTFQIFRLVDVGWWTLDLSVPQTRDSTIHRECAARPKWGSRAACGESKRGYAFTFTSRDFHSLHLAGFVRRFSIQFIYYLRFVHFVNSSNFILVRGIIISVSTTAGGRHEYQTHGFYVD